MAKPVYSPDASEEIFDTLSQSSDIDASVEELAEKFDTTPKSIKLHVSSKDRDKYNKWFKGYEGEVTSKKTKAEMVTDMMDILETGETQRNYILNSLKGSSYGKEFTQDLHKKMVYLALRDWDSYFSTQRDRIHQWKIPTGMLSGMLGTLVFLTTSVMLLAKPGFFFEKLATPFARFSWAFILLLYLAQGIHLYLRDYNRALSELQALKKEEEDLTEKYEKATKNIPEATLKKIYEARWLEQRKLVAGVYKETIMSITKFVGFEGEPQEPKVYGFYEYLYRINPTLIWNRRGANGIFFRHLDKKIKKKSEWVDKEIEQQNLGLWRKL